MIVHIVMFRMDGIKMAENNIILNRIYQVTVSLSACLN